MKSANRLLNGQLRWLAQDKQGQIRALELRDSNSVAPKEIFHLGSPEIAFLDPDYLRRRPALLDKLDEVCIGSYDSVPVLTRIIPDDDIRCELRKAGVKDVSEIRKQVRQPPYQLWGEIRIEE